MSLPKKESGHSASSGENARVPQHEPSEWALDDAPPAGPRADTILPPDENTIRSARDLIAAQEGAVGGRSAAMLIRQNLEAMTSSVREMEDFLKTATSGPVAASESAEGTPRRGRGRRGGKAGREFAPKNAAPGGRKGRKARAAAQAPVPPPPPPPPAPLPQAPADAPAPDPVAAAPVPSPAPATVAPPPRDLPVIRAADLQRLAPEALLSLAREQGVFVGQDPRRRQGLVMGLLLKHVHRGGAVEGEGFFLPSGEGPESPRGGFRGHAGFLRSPHNGLRPASEDVAMPTDLRDRLGLRPGDLVVTRTRFLPQGSGGLFEATDVVSVNGMSPDRSRETPPFAALPSEPPSRPVGLRSAAAPSQTLDLIDALAPLAFGQRGLLVAPDPRRASVTLAALAGAVAAANPAAKVFLVSPASIVADDAAEGSDAVTRLRTDFEDGADRHVRLVSDVADLARRTAELGHDAVVFLDGLTPLLGESAAALGLSVPRRAEDGALPALRRLFASARSVRGGGSATVVAATVAPTGRCAGLDQLRAGALELFEPLADWFVRVAPSDAACPIDATVSRSDAAARLRPDNDDALRAALSDPATAPAALKAFFKRLPPPPAVEAIPSFQAPV